MELPVILAAPDPLDSLRSEGIPLADPESDTFGEFGEDGEGEYAQPRSLADRLGDWLEYRIEMGRARLESDAPFREAEIARKVSLLESQTARETGLLDAQNKLRQAHLKANAGRAGARGKADASAAGFGSDKGKLPGSRGGAGRSGGSGRGGGTTGPGGSSGRGSGAGSGRGSGGGNSPRSAGKGTDRSAGGRSGGAKGNESSGGSKGRQNGSGGSSGSGKGTPGKGSSGSSGRNGLGSSGSGKGGTKGDGGKAQNTPSSPAAERARGRQERAAARQTARQQRAATRQLAGLADRSKDRDQDREHRQAAREQATRRAEKDRRRKEKAGRRAQKEAAQNKAAKDRETAGTQRITFGEAVAEEAQRRWDQRRAEAGADTGETSGKREKKARSGAGNRRDGPSDEASDPQRDGQDNDQTTADGTSGGPEAGPDGDSRHWWQSGRNNRREQQGRRAAGSPFGRDRTPPTAEWADGRPHRPDPQPQTVQDIPEAAVVHDDGDPFGWYAARRAGLPRAPESRIKRPGTTRPTAQEDPVASEVRKTASGQAGMAARHRTDITFDEYLVEIVNVAIAAALDKDRAQDLAIALGKVADALRDMAADLVGDHNIATQVVGQITDLADAASRMKQLAERCATECEVASEAALLAATAVGRTYGEDITAMDNAGLAHASAAAHHD